MTVSSSAEREVLEAIRSGEFTKVEATLQDGRIRTVTTPGHPDASAELTSLLRDNAYQKLTVQRKETRELWPSSR